MKLPVQNFKKTYDFQESDNLTKAQQSVINNLKYYLSTRRLTAAYGSLESTHQKIRIYLAETLLKIVANNLTSYNYYHQQYLNLLEHYQSSDPMFLMDDEFEDMVKKPMEKQIDKLQWNDSKYIIPM